MGLPDSGAGERVILRVGGEGGSLELWERPGSRPQFKATMNDQSLQWFDEGDAVTRDSGWGDQRAAMRLVDRYQWTRLRPKVVDPAHAHWVWARVRDDWEQVREGNRPDWLELCRRDGRLPFTAARGEYVRNPSYGLGKILFADGAHVIAYFKGHPAPRPDGRVVKFQAGTTSLEGVTETRDEELDNLPPWVDGKFKVAKTDLDLVKAIGIFLQFFPGGFSDPNYLRRERDYKASASHRFDSIARPALAGWIAEGNADAIARALDAVYGDPKAPQEGADTRLNVLYQQVEEPAYFDALRTGGPATVEYAAAALEFIRAGDKASFDSYLAALGALPTRRGGAHLAHWTTLTWLPFIADPKRHFLVKPTIIQAYEAMLGYDIRYRSELNFETYARCVSLAERLKARLEQSEINLGKRPLDMIDVQSFMWVVERWSPGDIKA
jgi:hypothetical protein